MLTFSHPIESPKPHRNKDTRHLQVSRDNNILKFDSSPPKELSLHRYLDAKRLGRSGSRSQPEYFP